LENANLIPDKYIQKNLVWSENGESTRIYWLTEIPLSTWIQNISPSTITGEPGFLSAPFDDELGTLRGQEWINMILSEYDFRLRVGSRCIDSGAFLTRTVQAGTGNVIRVDNASHFTDGFRIEGQGDSIQIGSNKPVKIIEIDYMRNLITVDKDIIWKDNDTVSFPYSGSAPDIGAFDFRKNKYIHPPKGLIIKN
jgi:hypothetical protein